jgi:hypothetical protein
MYLVRDPDGTVWDRSHLRDPDDREFSSNLATGIYRLYPVTQDPASRQWYVSGGDDHSRLVPAREVDTWPTVEQETRHDPAIDRLAGLLAPVLASLPPEQAAEIGRALDEVLALPEQWARKRAQAYRTGARRGR